MDTKTINIYTKDELKVMSMEELQAVLVAVQDTEQTLPDILKQQAEAAKLIIEAKAADVVEEVKEDVQKVKEKTVSWWTEHRMDVYIIAGLSILTYIAGRLH